MLICSAISNKVIATLRYKSSITGKDGVGRFVLSSFYRLSKDGKFKDIKCGEEREKAFSNKFFLMDLLRDNREFLRKQKGDKVIIKAENEKESDVLDGVDLEVPL